MSHRRRIELSARMNEKDKAGQKEISDIQQAKPIVMLHNSGGAVTAFSWLQRVLARTRPPPEANALRGPLRYLIASLSSNAAWTRDLGAPDVIMMRTLAERAPQLFSKSIVSVDIFTDSEEQMLEVISEREGTGKLGAGGSYQQREA